jgi:branched-chain amino acid transport system permease protein
MMRNRRIAIAFAPWLALAALAVYVDVAGSDFLLHLAIVTAIYAILAMSLDLAFGYTGLFSIAHASLFGLGAYVAGLLIAELGLPPPLAILSGALFAALIGTIMVALFSRMEGPYFAIGSFAFGELVRIVLNEWRSLTHGPMGLVFPPQAGKFPFMWIGIDFRDKRELFVVVAVLTAMVAAGLWLVLKSRLGGRMTYVRDDPNLAMSLGVDVFRTKLASFAISGFVAGLAGGLFGIYLQFVAPSLFSGLESVRLVMMVVIGGAGTLFGPIVGAALIVLLPQALRMDPTDSLIINGVILVLVVLFFPRGIVGSAHDFILRQLLPADGGAISPAAAPAPEGSAAP